MDCRVALPLVCLSCIMLCPLILQSAVAAAEEPQDVGVGALRTLKDDFGKDDDDSGRFISKKGFDDDDKDDDGLDGFPKVSITWYRNHCLKGRRRVIRFRSKYSGDDDGFDGDDRRRLLDDGYAGDDDDSTAAILAVRPKFRSCYSYKRWFTKFGYDFDDDSGYFDNDDRRRRLLGRSFF